jgi:hypothetical protein
MSKQTNATAISTIGVDTGKNTLHLVGLDRQGTIVLRETCSQPDWNAARECTTMLNRHRGWHGDALCCS